MEQEIENSRVSQNVAASVNSPALLRFSTGWRETLDGEIRQSGKILVDYDSGRLAKCHTTWRGADIWEITAFIRFHPGGQLISGPLLQDLRNEQGFVYDHRAQPLETTVPADATAVEMWFYSSYQLSSFCEAWDSRFGQNYWFCVTPA